MAPLTTLLRPRSLFNRGVSMPCAAAFALFSCAFASSSSAQSCVSPTLITQINTPYSFDTCTSSYRPSVLCADLGGVFPTAPAVVYQVNLAYPSQGLTLNVVPSMVAQNFDPVVVIQRGPCGETGACPFAVDSAGPGGTEQVDLSQLDSGVYFIVVTSQDATCGTAFVSINGFSTENDADGIFRARLDH
jgi:hypothetical protein